MCIWHIWVQIQMLLEANTFITLLYLLKDSVLLYLIMCYFLPWKRVWREICSDTPFSFKIVLLLKLSTFWFIFFFPYKIKLLAWSASSVSGSDVKAGGSGGGWIIWSSVKWTETLTKSELVLLVVAAAVFYSFFSLSLSLNRWHGSLDVPWRSRSLKSHFQPRWDVGSLLTLVPLAFDGEDGYITQAVSGAASEPRGPTEEFNGVLGVLGSSIHSQAVEVCR